jgi:hypothetical protein
VKRAEPKPPPFPQTPEVQAYMRTLTLRELAGKVEALGYLAVAAELQRRLEARRSMDEAWVDGG